MEYQFLHQGIQISQAEEPRQLEILDHLLGNCLEGGQEEEETTGPTVGQVHRGGRRVRRGTTPLQGTETRYPGIFYPVDVSNITSNWKFSLKRG